MLRALVRWLFVPLYLCALCSVWVFAAELEQARVAHGFVLDLTSLSLFTLLGATVLVEALVPWNATWSYAIFRDPVGWQKLARDVVYVLFISQLSTRLIAWAAPVFTTQRWSIWPREAPLGVRIALAFFAVEFCSYWFHRAAHRVPLLWRFHATHHVVSELTALKALRTHPIDNLGFAVVRGLPVLLLGCGPTELAAAIFAGGALGLLAHANVDVSAGLLSWFVNVPRAHAAHHALEVSRGTVNFGCHTVLWDRLFGTFVPGTDGVTELGVAPQEPRSVWRELVGPFYRSTP